MAVNVSACLVDAKYFMPHVTIIFITKITMTTGRNETHSKLVGLSAVLLQAVIHPSTCPLLEFNAAQPNTMIDEAEPKMISEMRNARTINLTSYLLHHRRQRIENGLLTE